MKNNWFKEHVPEIIFGGCIASMIGGTVLAVTQTPKALKAMEGKETKWEKFKAAAPHYILPAVLEIGGATGCCVILGQKNKQIAASAVALASAEKMLYEYKAATKKVLGDEKEKEVAKQATDQTVATSIVPDELKEKNDGKDLIFDATTGLFFRANREKVEDCVKQLYTYLIEDGRDSDHYEDVGSLYSMLNLNTARAFRDIGWNAADDGLNVNTFRIYWESTLDMNGRPCYKMVWGIEPHVCPEKTLRELREFRRS